MDKLRIVRLETENVQRVEAVEIVPTKESLVVIGGDNEQGKTSVLDSIMYAISGKRSMPTEPLRQGATHGHVTLDLEEIEITRSILPGGGGQVVVTSKEGAKFSSPQKMLDSLVASIAFDPLAFTKLPAAEQTKTLQGFLGDDFNKALIDMDTEIKTVYDRRADHKRDLKRMGEPVEVPEAERLEVAEVLAKKDEIEAFNERQDALEQALLETSNDILEMQSSIAKQEARLEDDRRALAAVTDLYEKAEQPAERQSLDAVEAALAGIDEANKQAAAYEAYLEAKDAREQIFEVVNKDTEKLDLLRNLRLDLFANADFPVKGLAMADGMVTLDGVPFTQASSAQKLRTSVAMGIAMNPKLPVMLIRDGSLLDHKNIKLLSEMAEAADAQIWVERVGTGPECQVIIHDGRVKQATPDALAPEELPEETDPVAATK